MDYRVFKPFRSSKAVNQLFWRLYPRFHSSPFWCGLWQSFFERNRLRLPVLPETFLHPLATNSVLFPGTKDLNHGQDAPLHDLLFLLQLAKSLAPSRVLEIGTYRAKTTFALFENLPDATIVSYDIFRVESPYRDILEKSGRASLRIADFSQEKNITKEPPFDFIFIDAGHRYQEVLNDTDLAFQILSPEGCIIWHDYRVNEFLNPGLEVPEALDTISKTKSIFAVPGTTCAIYKNGSELPNR